MRKRKLKKRFYFFIAGLLLIIYISLALFLQAGSADTHGNTGGNDKNKLTAGTAEPSVEESEATSQASSRKPVICLDPGHGGHDSGTESVSGYYEKDINLEVALLTGEILEKENLNVVYTRTGDKALGSNQEEDLKARCDISNKAGVDVFVSIHCNYDRVSRKTRGVEVWCRYPDQKDEELAKSLSDQLASISYTKNRGLRYESDGKLYVLKNTDAVAVLVEMGFLSNTEDSSFLKSDEGRKKCAEAIAQAIISYCLSNF